MINLKRLRIHLENYIMQEEKCIRKKLSDKITIKRKKKMILEETPNSSARLKRRNVIKIEIIE